jgi:hypothetical protein
MTGTGSQKLPEGIYEPRNLLALGEEPIERGKEGLKHIKMTMKTVAPIEDKRVLFQFYKTQALLLHKAMGFDAVYQKDFDKVITRISKLKLKKAGLLSDEILRLL